MHYTNLSWSQPEAFISVRKNRLKLYDNRNYYLKNDSTFEIELVNPTSESVLAMIWLNDKLISPAGVVIKAHSRVYLERFIDTPNKFKFNVFEVDDVKQTKAARDRNGSVRVDFHRKLIKVTNTPNNYGNFSTTLNWPNDGIWFPSTGICVPPGGINCVSDNMTLTDNIGKITTTNCCMDTFTTVNMSYGSSLVTSGYTNIESDIKQIETGRIEEGGHSKQKFDISNEKFSDNSFISVVYQLLPESLKSVDTQQIRQYCSECGIRIRKSSWKFCPNCGEEL